MILFLNGPFGVGKTTTAQILVDRMPGAILYNPEIIGSFLRRVLEPVEQVNDFQDLALWPRLTVGVARILCEAYRRPLVVPMTVSRHGNFDLITDGLRDIDSDLVCVRLTASRDVLWQRILSRPDEEGPHEWCIAHIDEGLAMSHDPAFGVEVQTDHRSPVEVADTIMQLLEGAPGNPQRTPSRS